MKVCRKCGKEIEEGKMFCGYCGKKYVEPQAQINTRKIVGIIIISFATFFAILLGFGLLYTKYLRPLAAYKQALSYMNTKYYDSAKEIFAGISDFKDSGELFYECDYIVASEYLANKEYNKAKALFNTISEYNNSKEMVKECDYRRANDLFIENKFTEAQEVYRQILQYKDSSAMVNECIYVSLMNAYSDKKLWQGGNVQHFFDSLLALGAYRDCDKLYYEKKIEGITNLIAEKNWIKAAEWCESIRDYEDYEEVLSECYINAINDCIDWNNPINACIYSMEMVDKNVINASDMFSFAYDQISWSVLDAIGRGAEGDAEKYYKYYNEMLEHIPVDPFENERNLATYDFTGRSVSYGSASAFETALNEGKDTIGKIVIFDVANISPESHFGYDLWSGEHLNFIPIDDFTANIGDIVVAQIYDVWSFTGSWMISFATVDASVDANTIY